jgi:hypothetical protein
MKLALLSILGFMAFLPNAFGSESMKYEIQVSPANESGIVAFRGADSISTYNILVKVATSASITLPQHGCFTESIPDQLGQSVQAPVCKYLNQGSLNTTDVSGITGRDGQYGYQLQLAQLSNVLSRAVRSAMLDDSSTRQVAGHLLIEQSSGNGGSSEGSGGPMVPRVALQGAVYISKNFPKIICAVDFNNEAATIYATASGVPLYKGEFNSCYIDNLNALSY